MGERGHGSVIHMSSIAGSVGVSELPTYGATKAALDSLTRSQAATYGRFGIRVNAVAPGLIITDMWAAGREIPGLADGLERHIALRRWGVPEEIADVVAFLAGDKARYITGQTITVDGGYQGVTAWANYPRAWLLERRADPAEVLGQYPEGPTPLRPVAIDPEVVIERERVGNAQSLHERPTRPVGQREPLIIECSHRVTDPCQQIACRWPRRSSRATSRRMYSDSEMPCCAALRLARACWLSDRTIMVRIVSPQHVRQSIICAATPRDWRPASETQSSSRTGASNSMP